MYNEEQAKVAHGAIASQANQLVHLKERTIGENIDERISYLQSEIDRLKTVKDQMNRGVSLLDMKAGDLRRAMDY